MKDRRLAQHPDVFLVNLPGGAGSVAYAPEMACVVPCFDGQMPAGLASEIEGWKTDACRLTTPMCAWPVHVLTVLPTWNCNFHCSYCYASTGRNRGGGRLTPPQILGTLARLMEGKNSFELAFAGGGEPLLVWDVVKESIHGAIELACARNTDLRLSLVTNASLASPAMADFLAARAVRVTASWDILPDLQTRHRSMPEQVARGIRILTEAGVRIMVRSTVVPGTEALQPDMVRTRAKVYPTVLSAVFEPVVSSEGTDGDFRRFITGFVKHFKVARQIARSSGLVLGMGLLTRLECTGPRFCGSGWTLTPDGELTLCHRVAHPADPLFEEFAFGTVSPDGSVACDEVLRRRWMAEDSAFASDCRDCFARWNCGGGCRVRNRTLPVSRRQFLCRLVRRELRRLIVEKLPP